MNKLLQKIILHFIVEKEILKIIIHYVNSNEIFNNIFELSQKGIRLIKLHRSYDFNCRSHPDSSLGQLVWIFCLFFYWKWKRTFFFFINGINIIINNFYQLTLFERQINLQYSSFEEKLLNSDLILLVFKSLRKIIIPILFRLLNLKGLLIFIGKFFFLNQIINQIYNISIEYLNSLVWNKDHDWKPQRHS